MGWTEELLIIFVLVLFNGVFSGAEIAILTSRRNRLEDLAQKGNKGAKLALYLTKDANRFLSTVQVGITVIGTFTATYSGASLVSELSEWLSASPYSWVNQHSDRLSLVLVTGAISFLTLVLGELVPKRLALAGAERLATLVAFPMYLLGVVARPFVALLGFVTNVCLFVLRVRPDAKAGVSVEDIQYLIQTGKQQGVLEKAEHRVALEAIRLGERRVRDIMRPRVEMDAVDITTAPKEVVGAVAMSGFSRLPVYEGDVDHILGFIYIKDLFQQFYLGREIDLRRLLRPATVVPDSLTLDRLLARLQEERTQLAIVLDEFGGTRGMVTFEDLLEELVGEIHDEHRLDEEELIVVREPGHSWLVDGLVPLHDLFKQLPVKTEVPEELNEVSTVAGLVFLQLQRLPKTGDRCEFGQLEFEVVDMDGTRVDRVLVTLKSVPAESESEGA